jgi:hypothetical protein
LAVSAATIRTSPSIWRADKKPAFRGGRDGTRWYYRTLVTTYRSIDGFESRLLDELDRTVTQIEALART